MKFKEYKRLLKRIYKRMSKRERKLDADIWTLEDVFWNWHDLYGFKVID